MDESALIRQAQAGDPAAWRSIFDTHSSRVFRMAYRILRNGADAEDVLQETFIKAFHGLKGFDAGQAASFSAWIGRICVNGSLDALRRGRTRKALSLEDETVPHPADRTPGADPERSVRDREVRERIERAVDRLSPKQRLIFTLRHYEGYTTREIAGIVRATEGSVKTHLFRAVQALRSRLRPFAMEDEHEV